MAGQDGTYHGEHGKGHYTRHTSQLHKPVFEGMGPLALSVLGKSKCNVLM